MTSVLIQSVANLIERKLDDVFASDLSAIDGVFMLSRFVVLFSPSGALHKVLDVALKRFDDIIHLEGDDEAHLEHLKETWNENPKLLLARSQVSKFAPVRMKKRKSDIIDSPEVQLKTLLADDERDAFWYEDASTILLFIWYYSQHKPKIFLDAETSVISTLLVHSLPSEEEQQFLARLVILHHLLLVRDNPSKGLLNISHAEDLQRLFGQWRTENASSHDRFVLCLAIIQPDDANIVLEVEALRQTYRTKLENGTLAITDAFHLLLLMHLYAEQPPIRKANRANAEKKVNYVEEDIGLEYQDPPPDSPAYHWDWKNFGNVEIKKSQLSPDIDTGNGVFAITDFEKGDVITQYCGDYFIQSTVTKKLERSNSTPYLRTDRKTGGSGVLINGEGDVSKLKHPHIECGQIIQDPRNKAFLNSENQVVLGLHVPVEYRDPDCVRGRRVPKDAAKRLHFYEIATRDIKAGEEIFTDYGYTEQEYEQHHMISKTS